MALNEEQYRLLCESCDRVLMAPDSTVERISIPWLHVIREHPVFLENYSDIFEPLGPIRTMGRQMFRSLRNSAGMLRQLGISIRAGERRWIEAEKIPGQIDVLLVSHLLNASQAGLEDDFYYGKLTEDLSAQGCTAVIALINYSGIHGVSLISKFNKNATPRVILTKSLSICEEFEIHRRLRKESSILKRQAKKETDGLLKKLYFRASKEVLSVGTHSALRISQQIGALVSQLKPKAILVTYEGHAWERLVFAAARDACPPVRCIGYQHAALFRLQHAIRRNLAREYTPDMILTAGAISKAQLEVAPKPAGVPISVLGSNRAIKDSSKTANCSNNPAHPISSTCLVLPEGIASECHILFNFSLACALSRPDINFIWRLHPLMNFETLKRKGRIFHHLPKNIQLSQKTLEEDIASSCCAIYRGSTAIVQAVSAGLKPIYLKLPNEISIDPLYEINGYRAQIGSVEEFLGAINNIQSTGTEHSEADIEVARKYCDDFYLPFDCRVLIDAINANTNCN